ncbi:MAG: hypothetical protein H6719_16450 [Sandaracinaceae bacterium]|nr:hypothetical protein [Sandaracinaceae bacterium]
MAIQAVRVGLALVALGGCANPASHTVDAAAPDAGTDAGCAARTCVTAFRGEEEPTHYQAGYWHGYFGPQNLYGGVSADDVEDSLACDRVEVNPVRDPFSAIAFVVWGHDEDADGYPDPGVYPVFEDERFAERALDDRTERPLGAFVKWGRRGDATVVSTAGSVALLEVERGGRLVIELDVTLGADEVHATGRAELDYCIPFGFDD